MILDESLKNYIDELCGKIMEFLDSCTYKDKNIHFFESTWVEAPGKVFCKKAEEHDLLGGDD